MDSFVELGQEINKQHNIIEKYKVQWISRIRSEENVSIIREWFYEVQIFFAFHLYMEECFIDDMPYRPETKGKTITIRKLYMDTLEIVSLIQEKLQTL